MGIMLYPFHVGLTIIQICSVTDTEWKYSALTPIINVIGTFGVNSILFYPSWKLVKGALISFAEEIQTQNFHIYNISEVVSIH